MNFRATLNLLYDHIDTLKETKESSVELVYDKKGKRPCVIKRRNIESLPIYERLQSINNKNLPQIYRLIKDGDDLWIVEEFVDGETLTEIIRRRGKLDEKIATEILGELCDFLNILHKSGIIHRDIKPSNIMLSKDGIVKLIDFGIARQVTSDKIYDDSTSDTSVLGTRGYAPPEQYGFGKTDEKSDIYSLGVTFQRVLGKNYRGFLKPIIKKCVALDPANRYASTEELWEAVNKKAAQKKRQKIILAAAFLFLTIGIFVWHLKENTNINEVAKVETQATEINSPTPPELKPENENNNNNASLKTATPEPIKNTEKTIEPNNPAPISPQTPPLLKKPNQRLTLKWIINGETLNGDVMEIPAEKWKNWEKDAAGRILFPADWDIKLRIENETDANYLNSTVRIDYRTGEENLVINDLPSGDTYNLTIPLTKYYFEANHSSISVLFSTNQETADSPPYYRTLTFWLVK